MIIMMHKTYVSQLTVRMMCFFLWLACVYLLCIPVCAPIISLLSVFLLRSLLTNATSSIIVKSGAESDDLYQYFPNFLWLVRDASLTYAGSPTDYLKNEVLIRSAKVTPDKIDCIVQSIVSLFPSIECHMLPRPSVDPEILTNMLSNESQLDFEFIERLQDLNRYLCTRITPKGFDSQTTKTHFGGLVVAELIEHYVRAVNSDQDIVLQTCWHSAFQSALYSYSNQLIAKYQQQMKAALEGKLPLEQGDSSNTSTDSEHETLMEIHNRIASILYDDLCHEIEVLLGSTSSSDLATVIQNDFQNKIAVYDMLNSQVESGELLHFVNENYDESTKFCQSLFDQLHSNIHEVVTDAHRDKAQTDIYDDIETAEAKYYENAIGPAKDEILKLGKIKLQTVCDSLTDIPGPPAHLKATKIAKDEVMIRWSGASFNVDKVTKYTVECVEAKLADKSWNHVTVNNHECTATASGLKPHTRYLFRVYAYINDYKSCESTISVTTKVSTSARGAATFGAFIGGALITPVAATTINPVLAPAMTVVGLFGAPVVGGLCAKRVYKKCSEENIPYYPWRPQM